MVALPEQLTDYLIGNALDNDLGRRQQRRKDGAPCSSMNGDHAGGRDRKCGDVEPREYVLQIAAPARVGRNHHRRINHHKGG